MTELLLDDVRVNQTTLPLVAKTKPTNVLSGQRHSRRRDHEKSAFTFETLRRTLAPPAARRRRPTTPPGFPARDRLHHAVVWELPTFRRSQWLSSWVDNTVDLGGRLVASYNAQSFDDLVRLVRDELEVGGPNQP